MTFGCPATPPSGTRILSVPFCEVLVDLTHILNRLVNQNFQSGAVIDNIVTVRHSSVTLPSRIFFPSLEFLICVCGERDDLLAHPAQLVKTSLFPPAEGCSIPP